MGNNSAPHTPPGQGPLREGLGGAVCPLCGKPIVNVRKSRQCCVAGHWTDRS